MIRGGTILTEIDELYDKDIECPICNMEFTSKGKDFKITINKRDPDFLSYYQGENPLKYSIFVCPNCGYAATEENLLL